VSLDSSLLRQPIELGPAAVLVSCVAGDTDTVGGVFKELLFRKCKGARPLPCLCVGEGDTASTPDAPVIPGTGWHSWRDDVCIETANLRKSAAKPALPGCVDL